VLDEDFRASFGFNNSLEEAVPSKDGFFVCRVVNSVRPLHRKSLVLLIIMPVLSGKKLVMSRGKDKNNLFNPTSLKKLFDLYPSSLCSLASNISMDDSLLHNILSGKTIDPRLSSLVRISRYFEITVSQLIGEEKIDFKEIEKRLKTDKPKQQTVSSRKEITFSTEPLKRLIVLNKTTILPLSKLSGVPSSSLSDLLLGKTEDPRINTLLKLSSHFGVTVSQLIGEEKIDFKKLEKQLKPKSEKNEKKVKAGR